MFFCCCKGQVDSVYCLYSMRLYLRLFMSYRHTYWCLIENEFMEQKSITYNFTIVHQGKQILKQLPSIV